MTAASEGQTYADLQRRYGYGNPELSTEIEAIRTRGYIAQDALPVPRYVLWKLAEKKEWSDEQSDQTRQLILNLEG